MSNEKNTRADSRTELDRDVEYWQWRDTFESVADTVKLRVIVEPPDFLSLAPDESRKRDGIDPYDHRPAKPSV